MPSIMTEQDGFNGRDVGRQARNLKGDIIRRHSDQYVVRQGEDALCNRGTMSIISEAIKLYNSPIDDAQASQKLPDAHWTIRTHLLPNLNKR